MSPGETISFGPPGSAGGPGGGVSGRELSYVAVTSNFTNQTTVAGDTASTALIPGLQLSLTGSGRPVYLRVYFPALNNSAANGVVTGYFVINGVSNDNQRMFISSPTTSGLRTGILESRQLLTAGTTYLVQVGLNAANASTNTAAGSTINPMTLSAIEA